MFDGVLQRGVDGEELSRDAARARALSRVVESVARELAVVDTTELGSDDLLDLTLQFERIRRCLDAAEAHTLSELHERRVADLCAGNATSKWLADRAGLPLGVARQRVVVAMRLARRLPQVDEALSAGRIGFDHARVLAEVVNDRNVDAMAPLLDDVIQASAGMRFARWRAHVAALAAMLDEDGSHDPAGDLARNTLTLSPSDGFMLGRFELAGERALSVHDTLYAIADELFHEYSRDHSTCPELEVPNRATLLALALEEVCRRALAVDRGSSRPPQVEATVVLHAGPDGSKDEESAASLWWIHDQLGTPLPAPTLPTFLCDPVMYAVLLDSLGLPTDLGRGSRTVSPAQRRALTVRDGGCVFPGCDCPAAWADAHHVVEWHAEHGPTDLDNLVLLCRRHHRVAHRRGWAVELVDGWTRWMTPRGATRWGQRHHRQRAGP